MFAEKKIREFNNLDKFPHLKESIVPSFKTLPVGSINTKLIIDKGEIVERVYKTPEGTIISFYPNPINK